MGLGERNESRARKPELRPVQSLFDRANESCFHTSYRRWHRQQSKQYILRSQLGFDRPPLESGRPQPCVGCRNYHGVAYGLNSARRSKLICGIHPTGWDLAGPCPDWQETQA